MFFCFLILVNFSLFAAEFSADEQTIEEKPCKISDACAGTFDISPYLYHLKHWMKGAKQESQEHELLNESVGGAAAGSVALTVRSAGGLVVDGGKHLAVEGIAEGLAHTAGAGAAAGTIAAVAPIGVGFLVAGATAYTLSKAFKLAKYTTKTLPHCKKICLGQNGSILSKVVAQYLEHTITSIEKEKRLTDIQVQVSKFLIKLDENQTKSKNKIRRTDKISKKPKIEYLVSRLSNSPDEKIDYAMQEAMNCIMGCPTAISRYFICQTISNIPPESPVDILMQFAQILSASSSPDFKMFHSNSILSKFLYVKKGKQHGCFQNNKDENSIDIKMTLLSRFYASILEAKKPSKN